MRTPPPDPAKIREAADLYKKAYAIVSSNVRSNYPTALEYLNRAFKLDPDNSDVTVLKDRVQTEDGGYNYCCSVKLCTGTVQTCRAGIY